MMGRVFFVPALLSTLALFYADANAQESEAPVNTEVTIPADDFDRGTPLRSANGFVEQADKRDFESAAEYLDLRNLRGQAAALTGAQLARRLSVIIARATWVDVDALLDDPAGRGNDNLPDYRDSIGIILDDGKEVRLLLQKVPRGDGVSIWKISNSTVSVIPKLYAVYGYPPFIEDLRRSLPDVAFLGYELFKWVILVAIGFIVYAPVFLLALAFRRMSGDPDARSQKQVFRFLVLPFGIWLVIISMTLGATSLGRGTTAEAWRNLTPVPILITLWMLFGALNLLRDIYSNRLLAQGRPGAAVLLVPAGNAIKILLAIAGTLIYMDKLGINITTVLAGLGVGGVAVALALQKPMEDVFGAFTLYTQQPIRVGEFCRIGTVTGTIEEIGLRTTRLRTLADTLIAIPNAQLANEPIDNISARKKVRYSPILRLRYDTSPEQMQQVLVGIREMLQSDAEVRPESQRVRFKEIADDALLIEVNAYLNTTDWATYLELAEGLNVRILEIVSQAGTSLSLPAKTVHLQ